ncbi:MAG: ATP-dependent protease ATPase subunit HslU, partial [Gammaproteobacteria bacterium]|nr:ATP-dependent protease ATPase subunit HslU [Gammaproteobacteria bacterium]
APFIKVEATKFTEVGYVGRDVESIIRDLADMSLKMTREMEIAKVRHRAQDAAEERILDVLLRPARGAQSHYASESGAPDSEQSSARQVFRKKLREGSLDDREIELELNASSVGVEIMAPPGMEEMTSQLQSMFENAGTKRTKMRKLSVKEALRLLIDEEAAKMINDEEVKLRAVHNVEQNGIVFIDEIDKIAKRTETSGADVSREGVQRDLLPLVEGCTVSTKLGMIKTDHILFIASGAFHMSKPSDLVPELQGRLPIRVELSALGKAEFVQILTEPNASLTKQYIALMNAEELALVFTDDAIERIAEVACYVNDRTENIGARRLHTVMERLLETISYDASDRAGSTVTIDADYVDRSLESLSQNEDLSRYIL